MSSCVLKTYNGKFVTVRDYDNGPSLCAHDRQEFDDGCTITITKHIDKDWISFTFNVKSDNSTTEYTLQASGSSLKLVPSGQDQVDGGWHLWFEKVGSDDLYSVRVVDSNQYICTDKSTKVLFLSQTGNHVKLEDKRV